ncbi:Protein yceI precursor [hydrothermal vent metagenome]|uniref:Protein yceI n=1 Tax=hydrothermal vent metagenome TaxID=652676 RepID=A0A3B1AF23_9ZZZZ
MNKYYFVLNILTVFILSVPLHAENYDIDGEHGIVEFKIKHLGYSWLVGRFNRFEGNFSYDEKNPAASKIEVTIDTTSIDSNHAERDKHLRSKDFLDVSTYPTAKFTSISFMESSNDKAQLIGDFTLHGVTRKITLELEHVGHGNDPWGGYRRGFSGSTILTLKDYGITTDLGPASRQVEMFISIEGVRRK